MINILERIEKLTKGEKELILYFMEKDFNNLTYEDMKKESDLLFGLNKLNEEEKLIIRLMICLSDNRLTDKERVQLIKKQLKIYDTVSYINS